MKYALDVLSVSLTVWVKKTFRGSITMKNILTQHMLTPSASLLTVVLNYTFFFASPDSLFHGD